MEWDRPRLLSALSGLTCGLHRALTDTQVTGSVDICWTAFLVSVCVADSAMALPSDFDIAAKTGQPPDLREQRHWSLEALRDPFAH